MTQIGKKYAVMKPSMWMIFHCVDSPTPDNFLSWWQLCVLIIGHSDKKLRDLRNSKESR
jgi:hypothetical protein